MAGKLTAIKAIATAKLRKDLIEPPEPHFETLLEPSNNAIYLPDKRWSRMPEPKDKRIKTFEVASPQLLSLSGAAISILWAYGEANGSRPVWMIKQDLWLFTYDFLERQHRNMKAILFLDTRHSNQALLIARSMLEGASQMWLMRSSKDRKGLSKAWAEYSPAGRRDYWHGKSPTKLINLMRTDLVRVTNMPQDLFEQYYSRLSNYQHWNKMGDLPKKTAYEIAINIAFLCLRYAIECANEFFPLRLNNRLAAFA